MSQSDDSPVAQTLPVTGKGKRADAGQRHHRLHDPPFEDAPDDKKKSPNSLRFVLSATRKTFNNGEGENKRAFIQALNEAWEPGLYGQPASFTYDLFKATERTDADLLYRQIEAYARTRHVPSALLLLISRVISERQLKGADAAEDVLGRMETAISALRTKLEKGQLRTVRNVGDLINAYLGEGQSDDSSEPAPQNGESVGLIAEPHPPLADDR